MLAAQAKEELLTGKYDAFIAALFSGDVSRVPPYRERLLAAIDAFEETFGMGRDLMIYSAPGRTELGGNHTDHQNGRVLAAGIHLDAVAVASRSSENLVRVQSKNYPMDTLSPDDLTPRKEEANHSAALIRGILSYFAAAGCKTGGMDVYTTSEVLPGSGLSSSAAFEVLVGGVINRLFCGGEKSPLFLAMAGQYAENTYFGKPCGLMDQAASAVGGCALMDFKSPREPRVEQIAFDFSHSGYTLCIIDTGGSHADLTPDYAAIPTEMKQVAAHFGAHTLSEVPEEQFYSDIPALRRVAGDRAVLRAIHFFAENARVLRQADALRTGDFPTFLQLVRESGASSFQYLQNVFSPSHPERQGVSLALALCEHMLRPAGGAYRVHGGGFAGTVQAFVPNDDLPRFTRTMEQALGEGCCHILSIRPIGAVQIL